MVRSCYISAVICKIKMVQSKIAMNSDRGLTWTQDETLALIPAWSDTEIQEDFENCRRNRSVYEKIAE